MIVRAPWLLRWKAKLAGLPPDEVVLTSIGPILVRGDIDPDPEMVLHDLIHVAQFWELLGFGFVVVFWALWFRGWYKHGSREKAYLQHPMELEAYAGMYNPDYLKTRKPFAWFGYL